jgi:serine/threonine protein kinase
MFVIDIKNLNNYLDKIKEFVGVGNYGEVFSVIDERDNQVKAMKVMKFGRGIEEYEKKKKTINSDLDVCIKLGILNEFLVQTTGFFIEKDCCCLIMELCSCGDLQKIFDKKEELPESVLILNYLFFNIIIYFYFLNGKMIMIGNNKINNRYYEWIRNAS